ncbi:hypothetical protein HY642_06205 [Candidatus Woesearchaeota archaeon]|nr:hypothetical protein [Candidatus Woesearchaeota archaeon]
MYSTFAGEALRFFAHTLRVKLKGYRQYDGDAAQICTAIVRDCWNRTYFQTSTGHFCQFYTRDFGFCANALLELGYRHEVEQTLRYAMKKFQSAGRVTVAITPNGKPFDFPTHGPDSLAWFTHALTVSKYSLSIDEKTFLEKQAKAYISRYIMPDGNIAAGHFTSIRDHAIRSQSFYDQTMLCLAMRSLKQLGIRVPELPVRKALSCFWTGTHYSDTISQRHASADANLFPFWLGIDSSKKRLKSSINALQQQGLDKPFPLAYDSARHTMHFASTLAPNYEGTSLWGHLAPIYIQLLLTAYPSQGKTAVRQYAELIARHKNYLELYAPTGKPYASLLYAADEGMVWASLFLQCLKNTR